MENQLSFENQNIFNRYEITYQLIENGKYQKCYDYFLEFLSTKIDHKFVISVLKLLKYWIKRTDKKLFLSPGKPRINFLLSEWDRFELFVERNSLYSGNIYKYFKKNIYSQVIDNLILALDKNETIENKNLFKVILFYFDNEEYNKAEDLLHYLIRTGRDIQFQNKFFLANIYYFNNKKDLCWSYVIKFFLTQTVANLENIYVPEILGVIRSLKSLSMSDEEIKIWLPVYLILDDVIVNFSSITAFLNKTYLEKKTEQLKMQLSRTAEVNNLLLVKFIYFFLIVLEKNKLSTNKKVNLKYQDNWSLIASFDKNLFYTIKEKYVQRID